MVKILIKGLFVLLVLLQLCLVSKAQVVKAVNAPINDPKSLDENPSLSAEAKELVMMSDRDSPKQLRIFYTKRISIDRWNPPHQVLSNIYEDGIVNGASISLDGTTLFFHSSMEQNNLGAEDIYFSRKRGDNWEEPQNIGKPINSIGFDGYPSLSPEGDRLFFVRIRKRKNHCPVIMMAVKGMDGNWFSAIELPSPINNECETRPRILADGKTLLFSSDRVGGKGGYDIYQTRLNEDGQWSAPVNLEYLNTESDDYPGAYSPEDNLLFYQTKEGIFQASLPIQEKILHNYFCMLKGKARDALSHKPVLALISIRSKSGSVKPMLFTTDSLEGSYSVILEPGDQYIVELKAEGYLKVQREFDLNPNTKNLQMESDFDLLPEMIDLHFRFTDSLTQTVIRPECSLFSTREKEMIPVAYDDRNEVFKAQIKLKEKYQVEARLEGYGTFHELVHLNEVESYKPVRFEKVLRKKYYQFTFKTIEAGSARAVPGAEFTMIDLDLGSRLFPIYDSASGVYQVELKEQGRYQFNVEAEGYRGRQEVFESQAMILNKKFKQEVSLEIL